MISFTVEETGWLFERPDLEAAVVPAVQEGTELAYSHVRGLLAAHRGPGTYGHAAEAVGRETRHAAGVGITGRVFGRGRSKFKLVFLEFGTKGRGRVEPKRARGMLAFRPGGGGGGELIFRKSVRNAPTPAFHMFEQTSRDTEPRVLGLIEDAIRQVAEQ